MFRNPSQTGSAVALRAGPRRAGPPARTIIKALVGRPCLRPPSLALVLAAARSENPLRAAIMIAGHGLDGAQTAWMIYLGSDARRQAAVAAALPRRLLAAAARLVAAIQRAGTAPPLVPELLPGDDLFGGAGAAAGGGSGVGCSGASGPGVPVVGGGGGDVGRRGGG